MTVSTHTSFAVTSSAATATITVVDGDLATTNQFTEGTAVAIESHDGTRRVYVLCDASESGASAAGTVLTAGSDTGASTLSAATAARGTCVAFNANLNTATQAAVLNALKAAIVHANGHNGKITASADLVAADGNQSITFTQATAGEGGNTTITSDVDTALLTVTNFTGGHAEGDKKDKHTILNGGTISSAKGNSKSLVDVVKGIKRYGAVVLGSTGGAHTAGVAKAHVSNTRIAYNPSNPDITRSITDTGFVMKAGVANNIGSVSGLNPLLSGGSDTTSRPGGEIHVPNGITKYYQYGTWATAIFNVYRDPTSASTDNSGLLQSDGTAKAGITDRGDDESLATDNAATPTRAIPGELTILFNHVTFTTNNVDYSAITG